MVSKTPETQGIRRDQPSRGSSPRATARPIPAVFGLAVLSNLLLTSPAAWAQGFTEVTLSAGINHVQSTAELIGALPPAVRGPAFMTGGVAAGDYDGDGHTDLVFTRLNDTDIFYRNRGDGTFEQRTITAGFSTATLTNGISSGDIDGDGDLDLYMTTTGDTRNYLYLNDGSGFFTDVGTSPVAVLSNGVSRLGQGVSFGDYDKDGHLDLVTSAWRDELTASQSRLFRNLGGTQAGEFEDVTVASGIDTYRRDKSWRFAPRLVDLDRDGNLDLAIASDFVSSQLFWSNGDGTFTDDTLPAGVGTDRNGMGSTFGDYDGDGDLDWFITNVTNSPNNPGGTGGWNRLYRNNGDRTFTDVTQEAGVRDSRWAWGTSFFDYDNDGDLDLVATNGWNGVGWSDDRTTLWRNDAGVFTDVSDSLGITDTLQGRGLAHLDYDSDGDLDLVVVNNQAAPVLYRNDNAVGNYLRIEVEGTESNRDGVGAFITVTPDLTDPTRQMVWEIDGGSSFLSQNEQIAHFGLGSHSTTVDQITIQWPSGIVQHLFDVSPNQTHLVLETDDWQLADFNTDGKVDSADYTLWRDTMGSTTSLAADGSGDGVVGHADYYLWKAHFGRSANVGPLAQVPEPSTLCILLLTLIALGKSPCRKA